MQGGMREPTIPGLLIAILSCLSAQTSAQEWNQFRGLNLQRIKDSLQSAVIIDMRNIYDRPQMEKLGFRYLGVGR